MDRIDNPHFSDSPFPMRVVEAAGVKTTYYEVGDKNRPALVLLHGMSSSADGFRELMHELSADYRLLAPDIPGFGSSESIEPYTFERLVDWLDEFLGAVGISMAHLMGHSFGGALAVSYALAYDGRTCSMVLLAPSVLRPGKYPEWLRNLGKSPLAERIMGISVAASRLWLERLSKASFYDPARFPDTLWERRAEEYRQARASAAVLRASALHDIRAELDQIGQPTCVIWGEDDPVLDPGDAVTLSSLMPQSTTTLHLLPQCGHVVHIEQLGPVAQITRRFLIDAEQGCRPAGEGAEEWP